MIQELGRGGLGRYLQTSLGVQATSHVPITLALPTIGYRGPEVPSAFPSNSHPAIIPTCMRYCFVTTMGEDRAGHDSYPRRFFMVPTGVETAAGRTERGQWTAQQSCLTRHLRSVVLKVWTAQCWRVVTLISFLTRVFHSILKGWRQNPSTQIIYTCSILDIESSW